MSARKRRRRRSVKKRAYQATYPLRNPLAPWHPKKIIGGVTKPYRRAKNAVAKAAKILRKHPRFEDKRIRVTVVKDPRNMYRGGLFDPNYIRKQSQPPKIRCKARPTSTKPKNGGSGKAYVPWCERRR